MTISDYFRERIPPYLLSHLEAWVDDRIPPGSFLTAVLCNDLMNAVGRADESSILCLKDICSFVYNEMPFNCHGSNEVVRKWRERKEGDS